MHNDVTCVDQNPITGLAAFGLGQHTKFGFDPVGELFRNRGNLTARTTASLVGVLRALIGAPARLAAVSAAWGKDSSLSSKNLRAGFLPRCKAYLKLTTLGGMFNKVDGNNVTCGYSAGCLDTTRSRRVENVVSSGLRVRSARSCHQTTSDLSETLP